MNKASSALSKEIDSIAKKNGAILVGTVKIYMVENVIVIGTPFNENWHLSYIFSQAKRAIEEFRITRPLLNSVSQFLKSEGFEAKQKTPLSIYGDFRSLAAAAGLGHHGRNGLIINKDYSSGLVFSAIYTNAPVEIKEKPETLKCTDCGLCVEL